MVKLGAGTDEGGLAAYCPDCGARAEPGTAYCGSCGARLTLGAGRRVAGLSPRRRSAYLLVVLLGLAAFTGTVYSLGAYDTGLSAQGFRTYANPAAGFSFQYPPSWSVVSNPGTVVEVLGGNGTAFTEVFFNGNDTTTSTSDLLGQLYAETGAQPHQYVTFSRPSVLNISGQSMAQLAILFGDSGAVITVFESGGNYYSLVCGGTDNQFFGLIGTCDAVTGSLSLVP